MFDISDSEAEALDRASAILGEHFDGFALVALHDSGEFVYDVSNPLIGKALMREALDEMKRDVLGQSAFGVEYFEDDEES